MKHLSFYYRWYRYVQVATFTRGISLLLIISILGSTIPVAQAQPIETLGSVVAQRTPGGEASQPFSTAHLPQRQSASAQHTVTINDIGFTPATLTIKVGDQVTWINQSQQTYGVRLDTQLFDLFLPFIQVGQNRSQQQSAMTVPAQSTSLAQTGFWESEPIPPNQSATLVFTQTGSLHMRLFVRNPASGNAQSTRARGKIEISTANHSPVVSLTATPSSGTVPLTVSFTAIASDADNDPLTYAWNFGNATSVNDSATTTHRYEQAGIYTATVTVSDGSLSASASQTILVTAPIDGLPPDPASVAPALDRSVVTDISSAADFLYTGDNPVQTGVLTGTMEVTRIAVLRGKVLDQAGQPLPGAIITILDHPQYGQTLSRADGMFDLVVNGGGPLTVNYASDSYLSAQRQVEVPIRDYLWLPDVALIERDPQVTTVDLAANTRMQVARGSVVSDTEGVRQATLLVPQGVTATLVLSDGTLSPLISLKMRATEYTVGNGGPQAMPGQLPPASGYT
jgi:PKD repeat protein